MTQSRIEDAWFGTLRPGWRISTLGRLAAIRAGGTPSSTVDEYWDDAEGTRWLSIADLGDVDTGAEHRGRFLTSAGLSASRLVPSKRDTVLFAIYASVGAVAFLRDAAVWNQAILGLEPRRGEADARFLYWVALALKPTLPFYYRSNTQDNLNAEQVRSFRVPHPPLAQQRGIADYLYRETARIDAFIAKNEELIALLAERRTAVVDGVLARRGFAEPDYLAISTDYPVPEGWRIISLGTLLNALTNGFVGPTRDILVDDGVRYIQGTHIKGGEIDFARRPFFVSQLWHDQRPRIHLREGDVLIVQTGDIGKVAVVPADFGEASCHALQIARVKRNTMLPQFLGAYLSSHFGYHQLKSRATGALHLHLEASIRSTPVVVPPLSVQTEIVEEVRDRQTKIDTLIASAEKLIGLSKERRAALISAAVTGKIDVGVAA